MNLIEFDPILYRYSMTKGKKNNYYILCVRGSLNTRAREEEDASRDRQINFHPMNFVADASSLPVAAGRV